MDVTAKPVLGSAVTTRSIFEFPSKGIVGNEARVSIGHLGFPMRAKIRQGRKTCGGYTTRGTILGFSGHTGRPGLDLALAESGAACAFGQRWSILGLETE